MIPKIIHYCWFGNNEKTNLIKKCIAGWKKHCPDYIIKEWNETNFDTKCCDYVKQAYECKKWAFVSDYARFFILNEYGGIYLDTDVELIQSIDNLLHNNFIGFESSTSINTGLIMACNQNNDLCKDMIEEYNNDKFIVDGKMNLRTVCDRTTAILIKHGLQLNNKTQFVYNYRIYDSSYFNPYNMNTGKIELKHNTISIHHYAATWVPSKEKIRGKIYNIIYRLGGEKMAKIARKAFGRKK